MRLEVKARRAMILIAAVNIARKPGGWSRLTRAAISTEAGCHESLVSHRLGSMLAVRKAVMAHAIKHEYMDLIAQGIATGYPACLKLSPVLKHRAISVLVDLGE